MKNKTYHIVGAFTKSISIVFDVFNWICSFYFVWRINLAVSLSGKARENRLQNKIYHN
jgi:hypothetical protein